MTTPKKNARASAGETESMTCESRAQGIAPVDDVQALALLTRLRDAGVMLAVWPDRENNFPLEVSPSEAIDYARDRDEFMARHFGVTVDVLKAWRAWRNPNYGYFQCHAITREGARCRNSVGRCESLPDDPAQWPAFERQWLDFEALGRCCVQHGGARRREGGRHEARR